MTLLDHTRAGFTKDVEELHRSLSSFIAVWRIKFLRAIENVLILPFIMVFTVILRAVEVVVTCYFYLLALATFEFARMPSISVDGLKRGVWEKVSLLVSTVEKRSTDTMVSVKVALASMGEKALRIIALIFSPIIVLMNIFLRSLEAFITAILMSVSVLVVSFASVRTLLCAHLEYFKLCLFESYYYLKENCTAFYDASKAFVDKFVYVPAITTYHSLVVLLNSLGARIPTWDTVCVTVEVPIASAIEYTSEQAVDFEERVVDVARNAKV